MVSTPVYWKEWGIRLSIVLVLTFRGGIVRNSSWRIKICKAMFGFVWMVLAIGPTCGSMGGKLPIKTVDRKSTRLNSSHANISYAVFCLKKKNKHKDNTI